MKDQTQVVIVGATRSAIGAFMGALSDVKITRVAAQLVEALVAKHLNGRRELIDAVVAGNVLNAGLGQAPAKQVAVFGNLRKDVDCVTVSKVCGSGLKAISVGVETIRAGRAHCVLAGGMESMTQAPYLLPNARQGYRMNHGTIVDSMICDGLWDVYKDFHMGNAAELCAAEVGISRKDQDDFAIESYTRAQKAQADGTFAAEITPISIPQKKGDPILFAEDEEPKRAKLDKIPTLKPAFKKDGTVTAANASSINDGAAFVLLADEAWARQNGLKPIARVTGYAESAQEPEWFTTAPIKAIEKVTASIGVAPNALDIYEINEAFAVVPIAAMRKLNIPYSKTNIFGGAVALGHPIGCSGGRIVVTLLNALKKTGKKTGLATLCIGGGEGNALTVEMV